MAYRLMLVDGAPPLTASAVIDRAAALLAWYDRSARRLPWRAPPGAAPADPYRVWLSEVMLQQTTVAAVAPRYLRFLERWPNVAALAAADDADVMQEWAGLGYYARARNLLACARAVAARGEFPDDETSLRRLPGVGDYTAAAVAAIAFGRRAVVVDGNVERVVARLFAVETPLPQARPQIRALADTVTPEQRAGDFAQAMMDLGATICTPRAPVCAICPLRIGCAAATTGDPAVFPRRAPRLARPDRLGTAFWLERGDDVLLVTRPPRGLLGGMRALPTGPWAERIDPFDGAPAPVAWRLLPAQVEHVFTHFRLTLSLAKGRTGADLAGEWWRRDRLDQAGLPTLFARAAQVFLEDE